MRLLLLLLGCLGAGGTLAWLLTPLQVPNSNLQPAFLGNLLLGVNQQAEAEASSSLVRLPNPTPNSVWTTSAVTDKSGLFKGGVSGKSSFNLKEDLSDWDVSSVTNL